MNPFETLLSPTVQPTIWYSLDVWVSCEPVVTLINDCSHSCLMMFVEIDPDKQDCLKTFLPQGTVVRLYLHSLLKEGPVFPMLKQMRQEAS